MYNYFFKFVISSRGQINYRHVEALIRAFILNLFAWAIKVTYHILNHVPSSLLWVWAPILWPRHLLRVCKQLFFNDKFHTQKLIPNCGTRNICRLISEPVGRRTTNKDRIITFKPLASYCEPNLFFLKE